MKLCANNKVYLLNIEPADWANCIIEELLVERTNASSRHYQQKVWPQGVETGPTMRSMQIGQLSSIPESPFVFLAHKQDISISQVSYFLAVASSSPRNDLIQIFTLPFLALNFVPLLDYF